MKAFRRYLRPYLLSLPALLTLSCENFPKDPDQTLAKINNGRLVVGYTENPPWVKKTAGEPAGLEPNLLRGFAQTQQARVVWVNDSEQSLFEQLEQKKLHVVIGGLTDKNAWLKKNSFTRPYLQQAKEKHVIAVLKGENAFVVALEKYLHQQEPQLKRAASHD